MTFYVIRRMGALQPIPYLYFTEARAKAALELMSRDSRATAYEVVPLTEIRPVCEHLPCASAL